MKRILLRYTSFITDIKAASLIFLIFFLGACSGVEPSSPYNPMGISGKHNPEAENNFAMARILWRDSEVCSDPHKAIALLDKAIALEPDYAEAYTRRGMAKSDLRDWDGAFDDLTKALRFSPGPDIYAYRGLVSMRGGNLLGARQDYENSLRLNSSQHRAWNFMAALDLLENDQTAACEHFKKGCSNGDCTGLESARQKGLCQ